jgi:hypothetical protein
MIGNVLLRLLPARMGRVRATVILDLEKYSPIQLDPHMKKTLPTSPDPDEGGSEPKGQ